MTRTCNFQDLVISGTSSVTCLVTEDFEIGETIEETGMENIESVDCNNCDELFGDLADAKQHIEEQVSSGNDK